MCRRVELKSDRFWEIRTGVCSGATLVFRARQTLLFRPTWNESLILICVCVCVTSRITCYYSQSSQYRFNDWWHEVGHLMAGSDFLLPKCNLHEYMILAIRLPKICDSQLPFGWIGVKFVLKVATVERNFDFKNVFSTNISH
jgi:hypothetical protein